MADNEDINLLEIVKEIWKRKLVFSSITLVFIFISFLYAFSLPNVYKSDIKLIALDSNNSGQIGMPNNLGAIANFGGLPFGSSVQNSKAAIAIETLQSRDFLFEFIEKNKMHAPLLAATNFDSIKNNFVYDQNIFSSETGWKKFLGKDGMPSNLAAHSKFIEAMEITTDTDTGLITITFQHLSPKHVSDWLNDLIFSLEAKLRQIEINKSQKNLSFLQSKISENTIASVDEAFAQLIQEQIKQLMLTNADDDYIFRVVDPAVMPEVKSGPRKSLIILVGTFLGLIVSMLYIFINKSLLRKEI